MLNVQLCKDFNEGLEIAKQIAPCCAVECEYGEKTIDEKCEGVELAFYHHGQHADNLPPSLRWDVYEKLNKPFDNFLVSHIDLDTIMGIMWTSKILKPTKTAKEIAELVALQDIHGFHYIEANKLDKLSDYIKYRFLGIGYIISNLKVDKTSENTNNVSRIVHKTILRIKDIIIDGVDDGLKNQIDTWLIEEQVDAKNGQKLYDENINLRLFSSEKNLNSAYIIDGKKADFIIQHNVGNGSIVFSAFDEETAKKVFGEEGVLKPLKEVFGEDAGGRSAIGGTPRNKIYLLDDADKLYNHVKTYFQNSNIFSEKII